MSEQYKCYRGRFQELDITYALPSAKCAERFERNARQSKHLAVLREATVQCGSDFEHRFDGRTAWLEIGSMNKSQPPFLRIHVIVDPTTSVNLAEVTNLVNELAGPAAHELFVDHTVERLVSSFFIESVSPKSHRLHVHEDTALMLIGVDDVREPGMSVRDFSQMVGDVLTLQNVDSGVVLQLHQPLSSDVRSLCAMKSPLRNLNFVPRRAQDIRRRPPEFMLRSDKSSMDSAERPIWWQPAVLWRRLLRDLSASGLLGPEASVARFRR